MFEFRKRNCKDVRFPNSGGISPEMEFEDRSKRRSWEKEPKEAGMVPEMLVVERLRSWRDEREEREEEREERLRNVSGIEREITLF